jgi:dTDP-4-dehydrorhamnose 3,5-epimerase
VEIRRKSFEKRPCGVNGVFEYCSKSHKDSRGEFRRHFALEEIVEFLPNGVRHANLAVSISKNTFRGMHYQIRPFAETKLVSCLVGEVIDFVVDIRADSPTFLKSDAIRLSPERSNALLVPPGVANGYLTSHESSVVHYYSSCAYDAASERGFRFNDPLIELELECVPAAISAKDASWPNLIREDLMRQVFDDPR